MSVATIPDKSNATNSWKDSGEDAPYRTLSRAAVFSIILAVAGLLSFVSPWMLVIPIAGVISGLIALKNIKKYPLELTGVGATKAGMAISGIMLVAAPSLHTYTYLTEVPEGYQRVSFSSLTSSPYEADYPTGEALALDGKQIFIKGYIHPTSLSSGKAKKFILVPDLGTCCFGGQPPLTHMIEVTLTGNKTVSGTYRKIRLAGVLKVDKELKPVKELQGVYYQLKADYLK